jgi:mRNA interferase HigB
MRIISITTLSDFWKKHPDCKQQILDWIHITEKSTWSNPNEVKDAFP